MWAMGINSKRGSVFLRICPNGKRTLCSALTLWRNSTASNAMVKMLCSFLFWLIMSVRAVCSVMANTPKADCSERLKPATGIFSVSISLSADTKERCYEDLSNDEMWSLLCFIYPDYQKRIFGHYVWSQIAP